ncbi:HTH domain-containing protein [Nocardioides sp.]|uniref:HTH domain-containing protein n=1 Tax=Nocardioides sp. TaxID=35761 RepID=UPI00286E44FB|nr:HTH domain-containing protein [Nocardioides sp.]
MRAGRLVSVIMILQRRGRATAAQLADELEVSPRTILRDIEELSGAGVPVYAVRGPGGGFELLEGFDRQVSDPNTWTPVNRRRGPARRGTIRISAQGRQLAAVLRVLQPLRVRRSVVADAAGWHQATFRFATLGAAASDVLSLSPHVEVLEPPALRGEVAERLRAAAALYPR